MKSRGKRRKWIRILVNTVLIAGILGTGWKISEELIQRKQSADFADALWKQVTGGSAGETEAPMPRAAERPPEPAETAVGQAATEARAQDEAETPPPAERPQEPAETAAGQAAAEARARNEAKTDSPAPAAPTPSDAPSAEIAEDPEDPAVPKQIDFTPLWEISKDAKAWLLSPDTELSQVVAQTDNNDYYLKHLLDGSYNKAGTLFIDSRNSGDFTDLNTIIYGHSMRNKSMFGRLSDYREAEYCREHPSLYLYTPEHRFRLDVVAALGVRSNSEFYRIPVSWEEWERMLEKGKTETAWDFEVSYSETDHFVTLSTCAYEFQQDRWIVIARIEDPENILQRAKREARLHLSRFAR